jgi:SHS2 domain-containing protein
LGTCEPFEHTADVGLRITGTDLNDVFRTAAEGLIDYIVVNREAVHAGAPETLSLQAETPADLLADWLSEVLFRVETTHTLYSRFDIDVADDGRSLTATLAGEPIDRDRHILDHEVKAVTRHGLNLQRTDTGWVAELILDI